ncbi:MAG: redoxin family protein [Myxococcota bacterium]
MKLVSLGLVSISLLALSFGSACEKAASAPQAVTPAAPAAEAAAATTAEAPAPAAAPAAAPAVAPAPAAAPAPTTVAVGTEAPDFTLTSTDGEAVTLSSFRGKTVVLEWYNPDCPFVRYAHTESSLKDLAAKQTETGVVWLAINSGAPGKQGAGKERNVASRTEYNLTHPVLLDEDGKVGHLYGATRTPEFWIVDGKGTVAYAGALDNAPLGKPSGDAGVVDYVTAALTDIAAGKAPAMASTKPYGCSVKYAD